MNVACLILAAGQASRMGQAKQLLPFGDATLIEHVIKLASKIDFSEIRLVLGAYQEDIRAVVQAYPVEISINPHWKTGMGSSIAKGISEVPPSSQASLILLGDQPFVTSEHLRQLIFSHRHTSQPIIASLYEEKLGVPALFDHSFYPQLQRLKEQEGAGKLIKKHIDQVEAIPFSQAAIDIDTPEDYMRWKQGLSSEDS